MTGLKPGLKAAIIGAGALGFVMGAGIYARTAAQDAPPPSQKQLDIEAAKANRKALVGANMNLTDAEAAAFWSVYKDYEAKMDANDKRHAAELNEFAKNYTTLTDDQASKRINETLAIQQDRLSTQKAFVPKFEAVISPIKTLRFYQIDNKLHALIQAQIAQVVPLAKGPSEGGTPQ
jgi:hypothetical protein